MNNPNPDLLPALLDTVAALIVVADRQGRIVQFNAACARLTGWAAAEVQGRPFWEIVLSPEMAPRAQEWVAAGDRAVWPATLATTVSGPAGHRRQITWTITFLVDCADAVEYITLSAPLATADHPLDREHDLAWQEQKEMQAALVNQAVELMALHEMALVLAQRLDPADLLEAIVTRAGTLIGTDHGYLYAVDQEAGNLVLRVGTGFFAPYTESRLDQGMGVAGQAWATGRAVVIEQYHTWANRAQIPAFSAVQSLIGIPLWAGGEIAGVLGLASLDPAYRFDDQTISLLERFGQLASVALENARLYTAAQAELAERRQIEAELVWAKEAAEAASRAKSAFLANMSHELRTPLNAILGYNDLIDEEFGETYAALRHDSARIRQAGTHLLRLIDDVLDLSKIEAAALSLHPEVVNLTTLVDNVIYLVQPLIAKTGNQLVVEGLPSTATVEVDATRLCQVLFNLLHNAAKFTTEGVVTLAVQAMPTPPPGALVLQVRDTGIGMTAEQLDRLFQPFSQADPSTTRKYGGSGLGLALSRQIVQLMGGEITVASQFGAGSIFTVRLPATPPIPAEGAGPPA